MVKEIITILDSEEETEDIKPSIPTAVDKVPLVKQTMSPKPLACPVSPKRNTPITKRSPVPVKKPTATTPSIEIPDEPDEIAEIIGSLRSNKKRVSQDIYRRLQTAKTNTPHFQPKPTTPHSLIKAHDQPLSTPREPSPLPDKPTQSSSTVMSPQRSTVQKKRVISSPATLTKDPLFSLPAPKKRKEYVEIYDEDCDEEDMLSFIDYVNNRNRQYHTSPKRQRTTVMNVQCPLCRLFFTKETIEEHTSDCDGQVKEGQGLKKKTIGIAVAKDVLERQKKNQGVADMGPTNYYADSDTLAVDGTGFNNEVTGGLQWESAGQTRFG
ncbi:hypothetical protein A0J61_08050 [Choanephora cucurbitarum]|uniref:UBZ4-type domain-containing protein n=1 Tax=Choanephora cucurbitarum TaxID=101091 RepID=A0A1C7N441_9FUNG|nr:hypothetical protein A0J61_08050 [Choanephora cucurbitarum]